jgi:tetratricopeptide (TPR) repeat protein
VSARERRRTRPEPATAPAAPPAPAREGALLAVLGACLLARALASFTASGWAWGLNTFRDWPAPWPALLPLLAAAAFVPAVARPLGAALDRVGDRLGGPGRARRVPIALAVALAVLASRDALRFTGDALTRLALLAPGADVAAVTPQMGVLDLLVNVHGARALMGLGLPAAWALQAIGALTAAAFALAALAFLDALELRGRAWPAAAAVVFGGGTLVHLAGYSKQGPLVVGLALAAAGLVRLARRGRGEWTLALGLGLALGGHRAAYAVLPAAAWAYAAAWRGAPRGRHASLALAAGAVAAVALALLPRAADVLLGYDRGVNLPDLARVGAPRRLADALEALFLLSPLWPAALAAAWAGHGATRPGRGTHGAFPLAGVALLALTGELAVMLVAHGRQGYARDWDNQLGPALVTSLLTAGLLAAAWRRGGARAAPAAFAVALVATVALGGIHVSRPIAEARVRTLLADESAWTSEEWGLAHDFLGQRAFEAGNWLEAARHYEVAAARVPMPRLLDNVAVAYVMAGREAEARGALARAMAAPQSSPTMWMALARVAEALGDSARTRACADSARARLGAAAARAGR